MNLGLDEIEPGLVLYLDPGDLSRRGAVCVCTSPKGTPEFGVHFFLCTGVDEVAGTSEWVPLLSSGAGDRIEIPREKKRGHLRFVDPTSYCSPAQFWLIPNEVLRKSSDRSDPSKRSCRNRVVDPDLVDRIVDRIEERSRRNRFP